MSNWVATVPEVLPWKGQVCQYPKVGPPGIGYYRGELPTLGTHVDTLLYRNRKGHVIGILNRYPVDLPLEKAGNVNLWVHPRRQRRGIGTALVREAMRRWSINFDQQRYTVEGLAFVVAVLPTLDDDGA